MKNKDTVEKDYEKVDFDYKLRDMLACKDLVELESRYGNRQELISNYTEAKKIAPDKKLFTQNWNADFEGTMAKRPRSFIDRNSIRKDDKLRFNPFYYEVLGYDWINRGYNANKMDFERIIYNTPQMVELVSGHDLPMIQCSCLIHLARGASIGKFLAILRKDATRLLPVNAEGSKKTNLTLESICRGSGELKIVTQLLKKMEIVSENGEPLATGKPSDTTTTTLYATIACMIEQASELFVPKTFRKTLAEAFTNQYKVKVTFKKAGVGWRNKYNLAEVNLKMIKRQINK